MSPRAPCGVLSAEKTPPVCGTWTLEAFRPPFTRDHPLCPLSNVPPLALLFPPNASQHLLCSLPCQKEAVVHLARVSLSCILFYFYLLGNKFPEARCDCTVRAVRSSCSAPAASEAFLGTARGRAPWTPETCYCCSCRKQSNTGSTPRRGADVGNQTREDEGAL